MTKEPGGNGAPRTSPMAAKNRSKVFNRPGIVRIIIKRDKNRPTRAPKPVNNPADADPIIIPPIIPNINGPNQNGKEEAMVRSIIAIAIRDNPNAIDRRY